MKTDTIKATEEASEGTLFLGDDWFDPLEAGVRTRIRGFIEELLEAELDAALGRDRYERPRLAETGVGGRPVVGAGHRHGHRERQLMGTFGPVTVRVPRARLETSDGKTVEWKNGTIPAYQRRTKHADALIAGAYLAGTMVGATAVIQHVRRGGRGSPWIVGLLKRKPPKLAAVALANKMARIAWKLMVTGNGYAAKSAPAALTGAA